MKYSKKVFRRESRRCVQSYINESHWKLNSMYKQRNMKAFWNVLSKHNHRKVSSTLTAKQLGDFYKNIMGSNANEVLPDNQKHIQTFVDEKIRELKDVEHDFNISPAAVNRMIRSLNTNSAPGCDGITAEHLMWGNSEILCRHLAQIYQCMFTLKIVPDVIKLGVIAPQLKKAHLDPNDPNSYRPITLSSIHSKLIECCLIPNDDVSDVQFGYRKSRSTEFACAYLHDVITDFNSSGSPVFICGLDANKCFDTVWHDGLFYKLWSRIPTSHWIYLVTWYRNLKAMVKWNKQISDIFTVTIGTRQGSILSPKLFNIFINDLLIELRNSSYGLKIGSHLHNCFAYADDITLFASTT